MILLFGCQVSWPPQETGHDQASIVGCFFRFGVRAESPQHHAVWASPPVQSPLFQPPTSRSAVRDKNTGSRPPRRGHPHRNGPSLLPLIISANSSALISQFASNALNPTAPQTNEEIESLRLKSVHCISLHSELIALSTLACHIPSPSAYLQDPYIH